MCGINGFIAGKHMDFNVKDRIKSMNNDIVHRGPDDDGWYVQNTDSGTVAIGMRRLSIIDLSTGHQPMFSANGKVAIVFNGEIYNYLELRTILIAQGHHFTTQSDTEVVLRLYEVYGNSCLEKLNGMFAICIYNEALGKMFIARDRTGEKPLYYTFQSGLFVFASELKSITRNFDLKKQISKEALNLYLSLTFIPAPATIFEGIYKLPAAHFLELDVATIKHSIVSYWDSKPSPIPIITDYETAKAQLQELVTDAVVRRTIADVPLGVFLSGGIDSSIVAAVMAKNAGTRKVKTFSIGFTDPAFDESAAAAMVAKHIGSEHTMVKLNADDMKSDIDHIILNYDEPFADSSALPTYQVSKMAREHVTVALTGDGGDEVFGGYNRYRVNDYYRKFNKAMPLAAGRRVIRRLVEAIPAGSENRKSKWYLAKKTLRSFGEDQLENVANIISLGFQENDLQQLLLPEWRMFGLVKNKVTEQLPSAAAASELHWMRYVDKNISLEGDMLVKVDRASMLVSLECRAPFLDHRLFEFTNQLPADFLIQSGNKKRILKDAFRSWLPPDLFTLPKSGFGVPVGKWLKDDLSSELTDLLDPKKLQQQAIFNSTRVNSLLTKHMAGQQDNTFALWTLFCFQKWYNVNF
ncbi:MAG: asparagine synthase (glutamine-hydrolyzing) [Chitinophagaceae bacterium]